MLATSPTSDPTTRRAVAALIALSLSAFTYVTAETLPIGLLQPIARDLTATESTVGLLVTYYGLVVVLTSIPLTQLTRRVPRRFLLSVLLLMFVVTTAVAAFATSYWVLVVARVCTALSQALFWSIVVPTAAHLFPDRVRGRAVSLVFAGSTLAAVVGVPLGTWLGQQAGWRVSFLALCGIAALALVGVMRFLPAERPGEKEVVRGRTPSAAKYALLMSMAALVTTGSFVVFTYVTPFLTDLAGVSAAFLGPVLFLRGVAGIVGVAISGPLADASAWLAIVVPIALQGLAFAGMWMFPHATVLTVALVAVSGLAFAVLTTALSSRTLDVAPGDVDLAASGASTAVNVGITLGAFIGSILLRSDGVRSVALAGLFFSLAGLVLMAVEPLAGRSPATSTGAQASPTDQSSPEQSPPVATTA